MPEAGSPPPVAVTNTLSGAKEPFEPLAPPRVRMYVCGLTVYDFVHAGHARTYVAYDVIRRYLERRGYQVEHVQNITDVDDKIIARARETGEDPLALARRFTEEADRDLDQLRVLRAHRYPKVSEHMPGIVRMTETLVAKGHAYVGKDEHGQSVYYSVASDPDYGKLARLKREEMMEGVRKDVAEGKRDAADFALWKAAKPGEISWDSPWGKGRPGWHIECSVMATELCGPTLDIHGGGRDLTFPHHENELAQSESATGVVPFVRYWIHTGFLTVEGEKMSKSLGNFVTLRDMLSRWRPEEIRLWLAGTHYRSPIDYSEASLSQARRNVERMENMLGNLAFALATAREGAALDQDARALAALDDAARRFDAAMADDFNSPVALASLFDAVGTINRYLQEDPRKATLEEARRRFLDLANVFAVVPEEKPAPAHAEEAKLLALLLEVRELARKRKAFDVADRVRDRLAELGYVIEDAAEGPRWKRAR